MIKIHRKINRAVFVTICLLLFGYSFAYAQANQFKYKADIDKIDTSGVYKINLSPGLVAKSVDKGLYDIRVVDETGKFIAYAVINNPSEENKTSFIDFPEIKQGANSDTATVYIADNRTKLNISQLWLKL